MKFRAALQLVLLLTVGGLYAADDGGTDGESAVLRSPSAEGASVGFSKIKDGDVLQPVFTARFTISGMGIAPAGSEIDNTGHYHLLIDLKSLPDMNTPLPASVNIRHLDRGQSETELELSEGEHTLQLLLADYRHIPHDPPVMSDVITVTISTSAPPPEDEKKD